MKTLSNYSLKQNNSFAVDSISPLVYCPSSESDLQELADLLPASFYILGEGYNTLLVDSRAPVIIKPEFFGVSIRECDEGYTVSAAASENWHELVLHCISKGINGLENLALIPGSVGAAPIQNIGAYGVELSQYCSEVTWFDFDKQQLTQFTNDECKFSYRESIFKHGLKNKGLITQVTFFFTKKWKPNLSYAGLDDLPTNVSAQAVLNKVIEIRQSKLPDPNELPNAGSFFKNPLLNKADWLELKKLFPDVPSYPQASGHVKVAAGWLIQEAGLKGFEENGVGVHKNQALVLVNYTSNSGGSISTLANTVYNKVYEKFGIQLEPEVRAVFSTGESTLIRLSHG